MALETLLRHDDIDHFWMIGKNALVGSLLKDMQTGDILDLGCGSGAMLSSINEENSNLTGVDVSLQAIEHCKKRIPSGVFYHLDGESVPLHDKSQDTVLVLDVLEHVRKDDKLVSEIYRVLKPGGKVIVTVPSYQRLYRNRDKAAGHFRRYGKKQVLKLLKKEGFYISYFNYYNFILFPIFYLSIVLGLTDKPPGIITNRLFTSVISFENNLSKIFKFPWGSSMIIVGER